MRITAGTSVYYRQDPLTIVGLPDGDWARAYTLDYSTPAAMDAAWMLLVECAS